MLEILRALCPLPTISATRELFHGAGYDQPRGCTRCRDRSCMELLERGGADEVQTGRCHKGWDLALIHTQFGSLLVNGVIFKNQASGLDKRARAANKRQRVDEDDIRSAARVLRASASEVKDGVAEAIVIAVGGLHEIRAAAGVLMAHTETVLKKYSNESMRTVADTNPELFGLANSVRLIKHTLDLASVAANPESAAYGRRRPARIGRAVMRLAGVFSGQFSQAGRTLSVQGTIHGRANVYQTFDLLLMPLLHNALKYSNAASTTTIAVSESPSHSIIEVKSPGPLVPQSERKHIFERGYQGSHGRVAGQSGGSGLGLYIATEVAGANDAELTYHAEEVDPRSTYGINVFRLRVPRCA